MLIIGTNLEGIRVTKEYLTSKFKMKDLNEVDTILGIKVHKNEVSFTLSQSHYIKKVLKRFDHLTIKESNISCDPNFKLEENMERLIPQLEYASVTESLIESTMSRVYNTVYNEKSRHISLRHEFVRQLIDDGVITITYIRSQENLADPFTKDLSRDKIKETTAKMGLKPIIVK
ncbi:hypothetical protein AAHE18_11G079700 [Arachis hypogaea]